MALSLPRAFFAARSTAPILRSPLPTGHNTHGSYRSSTLFTKAPSRQASQYRRNNPRRPPRSTYNRFNEGQRLYNRWQTSQNFRNAAFLVGVFGVGGGIFVYVNLERVPISGRLRFNCISPKNEERIAGQQDQMLLYEYGSSVLPPDHPQSKMVNRVLQKLIAVSGLEHLEWEVHVIDDDEQMNAFVMVGGKVFVFSGILSLCENDDGLAAVLAHEISHQLAHHIAEQISGMVYLVPLAFLIAYSFDISGWMANKILDLILEKPNSRKMESEADYLGLLMMSQACYDPDAAVRLWQRMLAMEEEEGATLQLLSTHPASKNRILKIQEWLPEAFDKRARSECGSTIGFLDQFKQVV